MPVALYKPVMAGRVNLPESCGDVARHTSRKVCHREPGALRSCPDVSQSCPTIVERLSKRTCDAAFVPSLPGTRPQLWDSQKPEVCSKQVPCLCFERNFDESPQIRPRLAKAAEVGQMSPELVESASGLTAHWVEIPRTVAQLGPSYAPKTYVWHMCCILRLSPRNSDLFSGSDGLSARPSQDGTTYIIM